MNSKISATGCETLDSSLNSLCLSFSSCHVEILTAPSLWSNGENALSTLKLPAYSLADKQVPRKGELLSHLLIAITVPLCTYGPTSSVLPCIADTASLHPTSFLLEIRVAM